MCVVWDYFEFSTYPCLWFFMKECINLELAAIYIYIYIYIYTRFSTFIASYFIGYHRQTGSCETKFARFVVYGVWDNFLKRVLYSSYVYHKIKILV